MAFWMDQVARGWLIYELTDSALQLGLVRGVQAIPTLLLSPVAGSTADRYSRKTQILVAQVIDGLMLAALALLIVTGQIQAWHVYATAFGMAVVQTFQQPARAAMIADLVPSSHLTNAIGLNSIIFNVARSTARRWRECSSRRSVPPACMRPRPYFIFWRQSGPRNFSLQSALLPVGVTPVMALPRPEHHRRMEIQLEERSRSHQPARRDVGVFIHRALYHPFAGICARHS
jgi:hypothetical protein